ncbi:het domain containing protein [Grosmannia clavigera kw1407]|uniref:Het domain containing protein n=1 Tax=Grosmannia clavigera (strain kw1407 / UAMH 11150) TaxID=655863 RepID=F0XKT0_GROCL|nr:het domain containing protein [Grosmannia clavigera kw1407]EFX01605.1 het domain containing protein [Grosmannia clavigera kw1407]
MDHDRSIGSVSPHRSVAGSRGQSPTTPYCGVCYFRLPPGALSFETHDGGAFAPEEPESFYHSTPRDRSEPFIDGTRSFYKSEYYRTNWFALSAGCGCTTCAALRDVLAEQHPSLFASRSGSKTKDQSNYEPVYYWLFDSVNSATRLRILNSITTITYHLLFTPATKYAKSLPLPTESAQVIPFRDFPSYDTASDTALSRVKTWLAECTANHTPCGDGGEPSILPRRVLRITDDDETGIMLKLVDGAGLKEPYACLSYRWVTKTQSLQLGKDTEKQFREGITKEQLPRLFTDVRNVVRRLGLRYLWIDSLCIRQDDLHDWRTEAAAMASIYSGLWTASEQACYPVTVQKWDMEFLGPDDFGHVKHGRLTVTAHVFSATIHYGKEDYEACDEAPLHPNFRREDGTSDTVSSSRFVPPPLSHNGQNCLITKYEFMLVVDGYAFKWTPDYTLQMPGDGYVASGTPVRCLILSRKFVLVARCVDVAQGYYERLGCYLKENGFRWKKGHGFSLSDNMTTEWIKNSVMEGTVLV